MNLVSLLVILVVVLGVTHAKVRGGPRGVMSVKEQDERRHLQLPWYDAFLYGISEDDKGAASKGKGKGGSKCSKGDDDDGDGDDDESGDDDDDSGGSKCSKGDDDDGDGDDDDNDDPGDDDDSGDDDDDDSGGNGSCHSIEKIPKEINKDNTVAKRSRSEHWRFYCQVFESFYANSHCVNDRCGDTIDIQRGNPIFDEMKKGICLLLQFHDDICPADPAMACQCDSAASWNPDTGRCERYRGESIGEDLELIGYCEKLTGGSWDDSSSGRANGVSKDCLRGCTRYIAAEGHACCPHTCDCTAQDRQCPRESCAYCSACCESCDGCDTQGFYPNECRKEEPCEIFTRAPVECPCRGTPNCPCDLPVIPECPCLGEPDCFCESPCLVTIELDEEAALPVDGEGDGGDTDVPDVFKNTGDSADPDGSELDSSLPETQGPDGDVPVSTVPDSTVAGITADGTPGGSGGEDISNDEGKTTFP